LRRRRRKRRRRKRRRRRRRRRRISNGAKQCIAGPVLGRLYKICICKMMFDSTANDLVIQIRE